MKKVFKFFAVVILVVIAFVLGVIYKTNQGYTGYRDFEKILNEQNNSNTTNNSISLPTNTSNNGKVSTDENGRPIVQGNVLYFEDDEYVVDIILSPDDHKLPLRITKEEIDFIHDHKNSAYEFPINYNGYTEDELTNLVLSTSVFVQYAEEGFETKLSNGNIYDIDDKYIYIICCNHGINNENVFNVENVKLRFINNEIICPIYLKSSNIGDYALLVVDKNDVSNELLNVVHSINTQNIYQTIEDETMLYAYVCSATTYKRHIATIDYSLNSTLFLKNSSLINGASGGGMFDIYGNYYGVAKNQYGLVYKSIFPNFYNFIVEFNPDYGEPLGEIIDY